MVGFGRPVRAWEAPYPSPLMARPRTVVTIGTFDGVHVGHAALVHQARRIADATADGTRVVAMAFDPHPMTVLAPDRAPARLTSFEHRAELLGAAGADEVVRLEPTGNLLALSPEEFIDAVVKDLNPVAVVEGPDFHFGRGRAGSVETLRELGQRKGFDVHVVPPVEVVLTDTTVARASSTLTRWLLAHGRVRDAAAVLGRPYEMRGVVERGDQRGRAIGFPTANLASESVAPGDGVYGGVATLEDGRTFLAAISVGDKPTFGGTGRVVEAYFLPETEEPGAVGTLREWSPIPGLPEYGWSVRLRFDHWIRDQVKFDSVEELLEQMARDCDRVRAMAAQEAACP